MMSKQNVGRRTFVFAFGRAAMVVSLALLTLGACGDDGGPGGGIPGTYTLRTVNGAQLPFIEEEDATFKLELLAETIVLKADNDFTITARYRETVTGEAPSEYDGAPVDGTWEKDGATITFDVGGGFYDGILNDDTITITVNSDVFVYRKI